MAKAQKNKDKAIVLIKKSNNLVESRYKFDIWETRFFLSILAQIRRDEANLRTYRIWYKDIIKTFGLNSGDAYASLRNAAKSLIRKPVRISYYNDDVKREQEVSLITKIDYMVEGKSNTENHEYIDVMVQDDMKPFLLQLQKNFTAYDFRNVVKLGVYSVRIYELLKQYEFIGVRTLRIDEMKVMFELDHEYQKYNDFFRWVIKPSEEEINEHTDLLITNIEKLKEGRKVTALRFKFRKKTVVELENMQNNPFKDTSKDNSTDSDDDDTEKEEAEFEEMTVKTDASVPPIHFEEAHGQDQKHENLTVELLPIVVSKFGVSLKMFMNLVQSHTEGSIRRAIQLTEKAIESGRVVNSAGFFVEALRGDYQDKILDKNKKNTPSVIYNKAKETEQLRLENQTKDKIKQDKIALFDKQKTIFNALIEHDPTFWLELEESIKNDSLIKSRYAFDKDVFENMQIPLVAGTLMAIAVKLRPQAFQV